MKDKNVSLKNVKIINVTSASKIQDIAEEKQINPGEVFVRVTFETKDSKQYTVSNKLRIITKKGYKALLDAKDNKTVVDLTVTESGFFYLERDVDIDDLFKESTVKVVDNRASLTDLFNNK